METGNELQLCWECHSADQGPGAPWDGLSCYTELQEERRDTAMKADEHICSEGW